MIDAENNKSFSKQEKIVIANILDKYALYQKTGKSTYSNFLNPLLFQKVCAYLDAKKIPYSIYDPYHFFEKKIIYFGEYQNFITFYQIPISSNIKHSHILGTLFSLGLEEDAIGDIFVEDGYFYYTNLTRLNTYLKENFTMIHHEFIDLKQVQEIRLLKKHFRLFTILVSSMRLDNIVSKLCSKSRSQVQQLLLEKKVLLNYHEIKTGSMLVKENDILSIHKVGKFKIGKQQGLTKKENEVLEINQYI